MFYLFMYFRNLSTGQVLRTLNSTAVWVKFINAIGPLWLLMGLQIPVITLFSQDLKDFVWANSRM